MCKDFSTHMAQRLTLPAAAAGVCVQQCADGTSERDVVGRDILPRDEAAIRIKVRL